MRRPEPGSPQNALERMIEDIGVRHGAGGGDGAQVAADFLGISRSTLYKLLDPDHPSDLSFLRVAQLTRHFKCADAAEHLALCAGGSFIPLPDGQGRVSELSAEVMREVGAAIQQIFAAHAERSDGGAQMTRREAQEALPLIGEALSTLSALYSEVAAKAGTPIRFPSQEATNV